MLSFGKNESHSSIILRDLTSTKSEIQYPLLNGLRLTDPLVF